MLSTIRQTIDTIIAVTVSLLMLMPIVGYFLLGTNGAPFTITLRFVFIGLLLNGFGIAYLANLAYRSVTARIVTGSFLGLYGTFALIVGLFPSGLQTTADIWLLFLLLPIAAILSGLTNVASKDHWLRHGAAALVVGLFGILIIYELPRQETVLVFQKYQVALAIGAFLGMLALLRSWRMLWHKILKFEPDSPILQLLLGLGPIIIGFCIYSLSIFRAVGALASGVSSELVSPGLVAGQLILLVGISLLSLGWLSRRSFRAARERLGLQPIRLATLGWAMLGTLCLLIANYLFETIGSYFHLIDLAEVTTQSQTLFLAFTSLPLKILLAASAGIGEEVFFRGLLQPKFGILFTTLIFAAVHIQYNWFGMMTVFSLGLILAYFRRRRDTTTTILSHFSYDLIGILIVTA